MLIGTEIYIDRSMGSLQGKKLTDQRNRNAHAKTAIPGGGTRPAPSDSAEHEKRGLRSPESAVSEAIGVVPSLGHPLSSSALGRRPRPPCGVHTSAQFVN